MTINFGEIVKNRYFFPVLMGLIIAVIGISFGMKDNSKLTSTDTSKETITIKEKRELKSLFFGGRNYELNYSGKDASLVENISFFEPEENWRGTGFLDWRNFYEGKTSMGVASNNHQTGIVFLEKNLDLSDYSLIEFPIFVSDLNALESAVVKFGDSSLTNYYSYTFLNISNGWKLIRIPLNQFVVHKVNPEFSWKDIAKIQFEITSRPNSTEIVNFDYLVAQKNNDYLNKWKTINENFLSLGKYDGKIALLARNEGTSQVVLSEVGGENFIYQASFIPQITNSALGLFFRGNYGNGKGYYLLADGINKNTFSLKKSSDDGWVTIKTVEISNFVLEKDKKYWLKVETSGDKITGFLSLNGNDFIEILSVKDDEFISGGVGIAVFGGGYGFFDDFKFEQ